MVKGKTSSGFEFEYDEQRLDDVRLVDVLAVAVDPESLEVARVSAASKVVELLLGKELKQKLYNFIGEKYEGRVPKQELEAHLAEIMSAAKANALKN